MAILQTRRDSFLLASALAVLAGLVGGTLVLSSSRASDVDLTSAAFVPADAGVYVGVNTDLGSSQWVSAFSLAKRLGNQDPEGDLHRAAEDDGGLDWEHDVAPFLGGDAAMYVTGFDLQSGPSGWGVVLRANDPARALAVVTGEDSPAPGAPEYQGVPYYPVKDGGGVVACVGDHLLIAPDEDGIAAMVDAHDGRTPALNTVSEFNRLRDELSGNFLTFVYLDPDRLLQGSLLADPSFQDALDKAGGESALRPLALVASAKSGGFTYDAASLAGDASTVPMLQPQASHLVKLAPANTSVFISTTGIAQTWDKLMAEARPQLDDAIAQGGVYRDLDDALQSLGKDVGLNSVEDFVHLFTGETAFALWVGDGGVHNPEVLILADVADEAAARDVINHMAAISSVGPASHEQVAGTDMAVSVDPDGEETAWAVSGGRLYFGTPTAVRAALNTNGDGLAGTARYQHTIAQLGASTGTFAYVDLAAFGPDANVLPGDQAMLDAIEGIALNAVEEGGLSRFTGAMAIAK